jgi:hypothetical protein
MMDASIEALWSDYLAAERDRIRDVMMPALDRFIDKLLEQPAPEWREWARGTAASVSDDNASAVPVRFPLFRRVLLPVLVDGVLKAEPGCARWLASFESLLVNTRETGLPESQSTTVGLLEEALRVDPGDELARRRLVDRRASYMEYTLHEVPSGVLYGTDGASAEQCQELLLLLERFKEDVAITGQGERFAELIAECDLHYRSYADYLRAGPPYGGYEEFLARRTTG